MRLLRRKEVKVHIINVAGIYIRAKSGRHEKN